MSTKPGSFDGLNEKQRAQLPDIDKKLRSTHNLACSNVMVHLEPEVRPGRGQTATLFYGDGEQLAEVRLSVYGSWQYVLMEVDVIHNDFDDECPCPECVSERAEQDEPYR